MKAMIFAAGLGTRLRPLTETKPKALVEVIGRPMLGRVIENLRVSGVDTIVVNVHHFADMVRDYLTTNDFGVKIIISDESDLLLDTGGGILAARRWLDTGDDEPFIVHNADILTDLDLADMVNHHRQSAAAATLLVSKRSTSRYLLFNDNDRMEGWENVKSGEIMPPSLNISCLRPLAFGGVHVISPSIFDRLEQYKSTHGEVFSIIPFYVKACHELIIKGYTPAAGIQWFDIGSLSKLADAERNFEERE